MTQPIHRTTDIYLASFLLYHGVELIGCRRLRPKVNEFQFVADENLHDLMRLYWSGEPLLIVPTRLLAALRTLKCLAIEEERQRRFADWEASLGANEHADPRADEQGRPEPPLPAASSIPAC